MANVGWPGSFWKLCVLSGGMFIARQRASTSLLRRSRHEACGCSRTRPGCSFGIADEFSAFPWDEIRAVQISGLPDKAILNRPPGRTAAEPFGTTWISSRRHVFGTTITLTRADGEQIVAPLDARRLPGPGSARPGRDLPPALPGQVGGVSGSSHAGVWAASLRSGGINVGKKRLPWAEVDALVRVSDKLEVRQVEKKRVWAKCDLNEIVNLHVLMGIAAAARLALGPDGTQR